MPRTIATNTKVDRDGLLKFVRPRHHAILMTTRPDGRPQASPVTCGVDPAGRIVISHSNQLSILFPQGRNPRETALLIPAAEMDNQSD